MSVERNRSSFVTAAVPELGTTKYSKHTKGKMRHMNVTNKNACLWCVMVLSILSLPLYGMDYSNPELKFTAKLPDNLEDVSSRMRIRALISLGKWNSSRTGIIKLVSLQDLGGTIGREDLSKRK